MKVLTAEQMRALDRRTIESGVPELVLMENAGCRAVEFLSSRYAPLTGQRIVIFCGKGNNGGDGLVVARQLHMLHSPAALDVVLPWDEQELSPCAQANLRMLASHGVLPHKSVQQHMRAATLVLDAVLGTGLRGPASGVSLELIRDINSGFPVAKIVAIDMPSGLGGAGEHTRPVATVTFTAPKIEQVMPPTCDAIGELSVRQIGTPAEWLEADDRLNTILVEPRMFAGLFDPRPRGAHKGDFGHVLVVGGSPGKGGAAAMAGCAALKAGAGLVTVAPHQSERPAISALAPELMTEQVQDEPSGKDVAALGPGLGLEADCVALARRAFAEWRFPMVIDADGLNALAGTAFRSPGVLRILTPHPGEMAKLAGTTTPEVQADRAGVARKVASESGCIVVLKGQRTLIALPCGRLYINPTGTPAMATAGSGDILTGLIAGLLAQQPQRAELAVVAAVWLHGRAGELAAAALTENCVTATSLIEFLPEAIREARDL